VTTLFFPLISLVHAADTSDYVDNNTSDVGAPADLGTHSAFANQQAAPDSVFDTLTEADVSTRTFTARTETYTNVATLTTPFNTTVTKPTGTVDGDILFQFFAIQATAPPTIDLVPTGWNLIATRLVSTNYRFYLYWHIASGDGASYVWSFTATGKVRGVCSSYYGNAYLGGATPIDIYSDTQYVTADTILRATSMSVTAVNSPLIFFGAVYHTADENLGKPSLPSTAWVADDEGWHTTADWAWIVSSMIWTGSGATDNMDGTISAADAHKHAFAVALKPAVLTNYRLDLEEQWTTADYDEPNEELCIYTGTLNAESLLVDVWTGSWTNVGTLAANQWNNYSVSSYLTSATFTIRFVDAIITNDLAAGAWQIDSVLLHMWGSSASLNVNLTETVTVTSSLTSSKSLSQSLSASTTISSDATSTKTITQISLETIVSSSASTTIKSITNMPSESTSITTTLTATKSIIAVSYENFETAIIDATLFSTKALLNIFDNAMWIANVLESTKALTNIFGESALTTSIFESAKSIIIVVVEAFETIVGQATLTVIKGIHAILNLPTLIGNALNSATTFPPSPPPKDQGGGVMHNPAPLYIHVKDWLNNPIVNATVTLTDYFTNATIGTNQTDVNGTTIIKAPYTTLLIHVQTKTTSATEIWAHKFNTEAVLEPQNITIQITLPMEITYVLTMPVFTVPVYGYIIGSVITVILIYLLFIQKPKPKPKKEINYHV
jgi:hypothetical protein